jgi:hypothetical protein
LHIIDFEDHVAQELARASFIPQRRRLRRLTLILGLFFGLTLLVALFAEVTLWPTLILAVLALVSATAYGIFEWRYRKSSRRRGQLQAGLDGQQLVPQILAGLDDSYYLVNNLKLPERNDDVDHVLVGPNGVFALETKHRRGRIFWQNGEWVQSKMSRQGVLQPEESFRDPTQQLKRNVDYLRSCINRTDRALSRRTALWIEGAVVFTHPAVSLDFPEDVLATFPFPVLRARELPAHITGHVPRRRYRKKEVSQIVSLLAHLKSPNSRASRH